MPRNIFEAAQSGDLPRITQLFKEKGVGELNKHYDRNMSECASHVLMNAGFYTSQGLLWGLYGLLALTATLETGGLSSVLTGVVGGGFGYSAFEANMAMKRYTYNINKWPPLFFAAYDNQPKAAALLIFYGADRRYVDYGDTEIVKYINIARTYKDIAESLGHSNFEVEMEQELQQLKREGARSLQVTDLQNELNALRACSANQLNQLERAEERHRGLQAELDGLRHDMAHQQAAEANQRSAAIIFKDERIVEQAAQLVLAKRVIVELRRRLDGDDENRQENLEVDDDDLQAQENPEAVRPVHAP